MRYYPLPLFVCATVLPIVFPPGPARAALDLDNNQLSDVWETTHGIAGLGLAAGEDSDGDGFSNFQESIAGTDPTHPLSQPRLELHVVPDTGILTPLWSTLRGKHYELRAADDLTAPVDEWETLVATAGTGADHAFETVLSPAVPRRFFRLQVADADTDGDGLTDWEEAVLNFDSASAHTERYATPDASRVAAAWNLPSMIAVAVLDGTTSERWPDPAVVAIRRTGGLKPLDISFALAGTATAGVDYAPSHHNAVHLPAGAREAWIAFTPVADTDDAEPTETIVLTILPSAGYTISGAPGAHTATVQLLNETATSPPSAKSAARFLIQAAFGPDKDSPDDPDSVPENVEAVMSAGFETWIDGQFSLPATYLRPFTDYAPSIPQFYVEAKVAAWWSRAMGVSPAIPGGPPVAYDVLRQRIAFCLSQILVVSDRPEAFANNDAALADYYDVLLRHAFGNYRDLLRDVTLHPVMGHYLSHLKNQKPDPAANLYPDENYAREIMQLFSVGLWELNPDGTRRLSDGTDLDPAGNVVPVGEPIPSYDNDTITNFARVFTGLTFAGGASFAGASTNWLQPMEMWDAYHDCDPKTLLNGLQLPARTPSPGTTGTAGFADLEAAIDNLFHHPNTGPFLGRQLIQRLVTSNPSPAYVGRVAAAFADNGAQPPVRGDMKAVIKALLLDPEARDPAHRDDPRFGKLREPFLRVVNLARAFDAASPSGFYQIDEFYTDHYQEPFKSPSVFNFYLPNYVPPGEAQTLGLVGPEFQIVNATSAISAPNYFHTAMLGSLHRWGTADPARAVRLNLTQELALVATNDPADLDELLRRLDLTLTAGSLSPRQFQIVREAVLRIGTGVWDWERERLRLAIWLIVTSPEFSVLR